MISSTVEKLLNGYDGIELSNEVKTKICCDVCVSIDKIKINSLFFLTEKVDEKEKIFDAASLTVAPLAIVASASQTVINSSVPIIRAKSVRKALSYALSNSYGVNYEKVKIIGVTGTNGKTTTATLIYHILMQCGYKVGFIGTGKIEINGKLITDSVYSMTTPDSTVLYPAISEMAYEGCKYIVMEVSSHSIALGKIAPIKFEYAIFTNLDDDHLDFHKTKDDYFKTKLELFKSVKCGLFNLDDEYSARAYNSVSCGKSSFGIINQGDAYATEIDISDISGSSFYYRESGLIFKAETHLCGAFNVYNALAALKCLIDLGIKPCIAKEKLKYIKGIEGRMEIIEDDVTVIIDYAHTPSAFYNSLKTIKQAIKHRQSLFVVFGCGGDRDRNKRAVFGKYAKMYASKIILTEDNCRTESFENIIADIAKGIGEGGYEIKKDRESAIRYAIRSAKQGDVVAVIGKGHEKYKIVGNNYVPFDERKIIEEALNELKESHASDT